MALPFLACSKVRRMLRSLGGDSSRTRKQLKCEIEGISCLPPLSLFFIITWSSQEALISLQLILPWIRDNKQPINGGLNQEIELESAAQFSG